MACCAASAAPARNSKQQFHVKPRELVVAGGVLRQHTCPRGSGAGQPARGLANLEFPPLTATSMSRGSRKIWFRMMQVSVPIKRDSPSFHTQQLEGFKVYTCIASTFECHCPHSDYHACQLWWGAGYNARYITLYNWWFSISSNRKSQMMVSNVNAFASVPHTPNMAVKTSSPNGLPMLPPGYQPHEPEDGKCPPLALARARAFAMIQPIHPAWEVEGIPHQLLLLDPSERTPCKASPKLSLPALLRGQLGRQQETGHVAPTPGRSKKNCSIDAKPHGPTPSKGGPGRVSIAYMRGRRAFFEHGPL